jgi:hypothetical protein
MKLGEANDLVMYCKNCNWTTNSGHEKGMCVYESSAVEEEADYKQYMTKDVKNDHTLPRIRHIKCPNEKCTGTDADREVIYVKYDNINLKYLYFCCDCETFWKSD